MLQILNIPIPGLGGLGVWLPAVKTVNLLLKLQKTLCSEMEKFKDAKSHFNHLTFSLTFAF